MISVIGGAVVVVGVAAAYAAAMAKFTNMDDGS